MQYRLLTHRLRLQYGPGNPDVVVTRPRHRKTDAYLDSDEEPTLVKITGDEVGFDLEMALRAGVLAPYQAPGRAARAATADTGSEAEAPDTKKRG